MIAANAGYNLFIAEIEVPDPGASGTIAVQVSDGICNLVSATAETRTLPLPDKQGVIFTLFARTIGGTITLTVTGGIDLAGTTTFAFTAVTQYLMLQSFRKADGTLIWLKIADYTTNSASSSFADLTVTNATINNRLTMANNANMVFNATTGTMIGTNANQKIALWGAAPVVQPATAGVLIGMNGNAGNATNAVNMNANGNIGSTFMNFSDIVACLKKAGIAPS